MGVIWLPGSGDYGAVRGEAAGWLDASVLGPRCVVYGSDAGWDVWPSDPVRPTIHLDVATQLSVFWVLLTHQYQHTNVVPITDPEEILNTIKYRALVG
jgi:hypothetical protein